MAKNPLLLPCLLLATLTSISITAHSMQDFEAYFRKKYANLSMPPYTPPNSINIQNPDTKQLECHILGKIYEQQTNPYMITCGYLTTIAGISVASLAKIFPQSNPFSACIKNHTAAAVAAGITTMIVPRIFAFKLYFNGKKQFIEQNYKPNELTYRQQILADAQAEFSRLSPLTQKIIRSAHGNSKEFITSYISKTSD